MVKTSTNCDLADKSEVYSTLISQVDTLLPAGRALPTPLLPAAVCTSLHAATHTGLVFERAPRLYWSLVLRHCINY